jgi:hypothetical protein
MNAQIVARIKLDIVAVILQDAARSSQAQATQLPAQLIRSSHRRWVPGDSVVGRWVTGGVR